jgi:hypothetical protein
VSNGHFFCPRCCFTLDHFAGFEVSLALLILFLFPELESTYNLQEDHHLDLSEDLLLPIVIGELLSHLHSLLHPYTTFTPCPICTDPTSKTNNICFPWFIDIPNSLARFVGSVHSSPSSHRVCHNFNYPCV